MADDRVHIPLEDRNLPWPIPMPTLTLYIEQVKDFRDSFEEALSVVEIVTGLERPSQVDLVRWIMEQDDEAMRERALRIGWVRETLGFISLLVHHADRGDD